MWQRPLAESSLFAQVRTDAEAIVKSCQEVPCSDGQTRRILSAGSGPPLLFVPMVAEVNFVWAPQLSEFSQDYRVILFEPLVSRTRTVTLEERAAEIRSVMDTLAIDWAHLVAWSDGGSAAYVFARTWPQRCQSIVLIGLPDRYQFPFPVGQLFFLFRHLPIERLTPAAMIRPFLVRFLSGALARRSFVREHVRRVPRLGAFVKYNLLPCLLDHRPRQGEVDIPALIICGDEDALLTSQQATRMGELLPQCRGISIVPGGEHFLPYTSPQVVNRLLRGFLDSLEGVE